MSHLIIPLVLVSEDESEFDYAARSEKGPSKWGDMKEEWAACKNGTMQSPIDLSDKMTIQILVSNSDNTSYRADKASVKNRGHDIQVSLCSDQIMKLVEQNLTMVLQIKWRGDGGSMVINGTRYALRYAHWHSPSEHTINGRKYDMELHMVHLSTDKKIAVVAVLYKIGKPDPFLSKVRN